SIIGRPRPLPSDRRAHPGYTLICEEPSNWATSPTSSELIFIIFESQSPVQEIRRSHAAGRSGNCGGSLGTRLRRHRLG
ncbi:hypothetical protein EUA98_12860, partial [Pengzhenrongella frigida]